MLKSNSNNGDNNTNSRYLLSAMWQVLFKAHRSIKSFNPQNGRSYYYTNFMDE